ncbi:MAG: hypothetical protein ACE5EH_07390 [Gammaproteobacteria bacterium]
MKKNKQLKNSIWQFLVIPVLLYAIIADSESAIVSATNDQKLERMIPAPESIIDDFPGVENRYQQGFNEAQNVTLLRKLAVTGGYIPAGTVVNSHMIFMNTPGWRRIDEKNIAWIFDGEILGVMTDAHGSHELLSNSILGAPNTTYPSRVRNRGLEYSDEFFVKGNRLVLTMRVSEPGDWIRVITLANDSRYAGGVAKTIQSLSPQVNAEQTDKIININARTNSPDRAIKMLLDTGTYQVMPVGKADGGSYDSWNAWGRWSSRVYRCDADGSGCLKGWMNQYYVSGPFGTIGKSNGRWRTPSLALGNAKPITFTLDAPATVKFYVKDESRRNGRIRRYYFDNTGGMSLRVSGQTNPVPAVNFSLDQVASEGSKVTVNATLSNPAPTYPVVVPFAISAMSTALANADHSLVDSEIVIESGVTGSLTFDIYNDELFEGDESIVLAMDTPTNATAGERNTHTISISDQNVAPIVSLSAMQTEEVKRTVLVSEEPVIIDAMVEDVNVGDTHTFDWSQTDNNLAAFLPENQDVPQLVISTGSLHEGVYRIHVTVTDSGTPRQSNGAELLLKVERPETLVGEEPEATLLGNEDEITEMTIAAESATEAADAAFSVAEDAEAEAINKADEAAAADDEANKNAEAARLAQLEAEKALAEAAAAKKALELIEAKEAEEAARMKEAAEKAELEALKAKEIEEKKKQEAALAKEKAENARREALRAEAEAAKAARVAALEEEKAKAAAEEVMNEVATSEQVATEEDLVAETTFKDSDRDGISDEEEGEGDKDGDGIPNHLDDDNMKPNQLQARKKGLNAGVSTGSTENCRHQSTARHQLNCDLPNAKENGLVLSTEADLKITLGEIAFVSGNNAAEVTEEDIAQHGNGSGLYKADDYDNVSGFFDFEIYGIKQPGDSVNIVIPMLEALPKDAVYRKYMPQTGWQDFVENERNKVSSAPGELGNCPQAGDMAYTDSLTEGSFCVQLTIEDGGPNDADGEANYVVKDPGGIGVKAVSVVETPPAEQNTNANNVSPVVSSGGGSVSLWESLLLILFGTFTMGRFFSASRM